VEQNLGQEPFFKSSLRASLADRCRRNPGYSLRAFARALKLDAAALSRVLNSKMAPSMSMVEKILAHIDLNPHDRERFVQSALQASLSKNGNKKVGAVLNGEAQNIEARQIDAECFTAISEWYHTAILELTFAQDFQPDANWIARRLRISPVESKLALERLQLLGLLQKKNSKLLKTDRFVTTADKNITSSAHRRRQKQVLEKSILALEEMDISERNHSAVTMAIDMQHLPEAKKLISDFNKKMCALLARGNRKRVYELQVSLFPLDIVKEKESAKV
jgi:uncharacterized protein (TIGR02147 family)